MTANLDDLKRKRDQLNARIQQAEARMRAGQKKAEDRVKVLVGAAIQDGHIGSLDDPVAKYVTEWQGTPKAAITIRKPNAPVRGVLDHVEVTVVWPE